MRPRRDTWQQALEEAYRLACQDLRALDPEKVARRAGALWKEGTLEVEFFGEVCRVSFPEGKIEGVRGKLQEVLLLHYLVQAKGTDPKGEWVDFRRLPGGEPYYPVFKGRVIYPFLRLFGREPERFLYAGRALGGRSLKMGDAAMAFRVFPRVEVAFGIWRGDDEFPPEGFVLFDPTVTDYLSTEDAIWTCHELLARLKASV